MPDLSMGRGRNCVGRVVVCDRQRDLAKKLFQAGLLSKTGVEAVMRTSSTNR
jgi:hypothetical protein